MMMSGLMTSCEDTGRGGDPYDVLKEVEVGALQGVDLDAVFVDVEDLGRPLLEEVALGLVRTR